MIDKLISQLEEAAWVNGMHLVIGYDVDSVEYHVLIEQHGVPIRGVVYYTGNEEKTADNLEEFVSLAAASLLEILLNY